MLPHHLFELLSRLVPQKHQLYINYHKDKLEKKLMKSTLLKKKLEERKKEMPLPRIELRFLRPQRSVLTTILQRLC